MNPFVKRISLVVGILTLTFFIFTRVFFFEAGFLEQTAARLCYPCICVTSWISRMISNHATHKKNYQTLIIDYQKLNEQYETLQAENIKLQATINHQLLSQELSEFQQRYNLTNCMLAKILIKHFSEHEHYYLLNRGAKHNVKKDMIALYKFQIVGRIAEVFPDYSKLILITDRHCKVAACAPTTDAIGIIQGTCTCNHCVLNYVNHLQPVQDHDYVLSSGKGFVFPEGFCLGLIKSHCIKKKELYHSIDVEPLVDLTKLSFCLLLDQNQLNLF